MTSKQVRENVIESYLRECCIEREIFIAKFTSPGLSGVPDRIIICRGRVIFVELKRPGRGLKKGGLQESIHDIMRGHGATVITINNREGVDRLMNIIDTFDNTE